MNNTWIFVRPLRPSANDAKAVSQQKCVFGGLDGILLLLLLLFSLVRR